MAFQTHRLSSNCIEIPLSFELDQLKRIFRVFFAQDLHETTQKSL